MLFFDSGVPFYRKCFASECACEHGKREMSVGPKGGGCGVGRRRQNSHERRFKLVGGGWHRAPAAARPLDQAGQPGFVHPVQAVAPCPTKKNHPARPQEFILTPLIPSSGDLTGFYSFWGPVLGCRAIVACFGSSLPLGVPNSGDCRACSREAN